MVPLGLQRKLSILGLLLAGGLAGCTAGPGSPSFTHLSSRECLARAMYFESNRSSEEGMLAVGTVVMNRRESGKYPGSVCGVVGQRNQFASGVLSKRMSGKSRDRAVRVAEAVLDGKRHPGVGRAMFFHTAGRKYPYKNMHYVLVAGGNAFYEKRRPGTASPPVAMVARSGLVDVSDRERLAMFLRTGDGLN